MTALLAFLLIDWVFYTALFVGAILIISIHESEKNIGWSHTLFVLLACLVAYKLNYTYKSILENPLLFLQYIGVYIAFGIFWAFIKWFFHLKNISRGYEAIKLEATKKYNEFSNDIKEKKTLKDIIYDVWTTNSSKCPGMNIKKIEKFVENPNGKGGNYVIEGYKIQIPAAADNKSLIISWILHWPISVTWTMINDPIKKVVNYIFEQIKGLFQKISNSIFRDIKNDFS